MKKPAVLLLMLLLSASPGALAQECPLCDAALHGEAAEVQRLLDEGVNVNTTDDIGWTALRWATVSDQPDIIKTLLDHGAKINEIDKFGWTALMWSGLLSHPETMKLLLENDANVNAASRHGWSALMISTGFLNFQMLSDLELTTDSGFLNTLIEWALALWEWGNEGNPEIVVQMLLDNGANINAADLEGTTALMYAATFDRPEIARILLDHGADAGAQNRAGKTALAIAKEKGHSDTEAILENYAGAGATEQ